MRLEMVTPQAHHIIRPHFDLSGLDSGPDFQPDGLCLGHDGTRQSCE